MKTHLIQAEGVSLVLAGDGARIDSRVLAQLLDIQHESLIRTIEGNEAAIQEFGIFRFQIGKIPGSGPRIAA